MGVTSRWARAGRSVRGEHGQMGVNLVIILVVVASLGGAAILLARTLGAAQRINTKADNIAKTGRGINIATDSVVQLNRTNGYAASILKTATPLEGQLAQIVRLADQVDGLARSINSTAGTINGTATKVGGTASAINSTAKGINSTAAAILDVGRRIDKDVETINRNIDTTIAIARGIKADTGNILKQAVAARRNAANIDRKIPGLLRGGLLAKRARR